MKKIGVVWLLAMMIVLLTGCNTSAQEFKSNLDQVMIENEKSDYFKGEVDETNPFLIRWNKKEYSISDKIVETDKVIGDITVTILLDEEAGTLIPESEWGHGTPKDVIRQKRKLLDFGMIYSIPNESSTKSIAVEINRKSYRADIIVEKSHPDATQ